MGHGVYPCIAQCICISAMRGANSTWTEYRHNHYTSATWKRIYTCMCTSSTGFHCILGFDDTCTCTYVVLWYGWNYIPSKGRIFLLLGRTQSTLYMKYCTHNNYFYSTHFLSVSDVWFESGEQRLCWHWWLLEDTLRWSRKSLHTSLLRNQFIVHTLNITFV